jgi:hypothetical protein
MEDLSNRTAQEGLDHHLNLAEHFGAEEDWRRILEKDLRRRNVSEDISSRYRDVYFREGLWTSWAMRHSPSWREQASSGMSSRSDSTPSSLG